MADGKPFLLGTENRATTTSSLITREIGPALRLRVGREAPPLAVNSPVQVDNLNAEMLNGYRAEAINYLVSQGLGRILEVPLSGEEVTYGDPLLMTAPADGFVRLSGNVTFHSEDCTSGGLVRAWIHHVQSGQTSVDCEEDITGRQRANVALDTVAQVDPGANTFEIKLQRIDSSGNGTISGWHGELTAEYSPYGEQSPGI